MFPFVIPWDDGSDSVTNLSVLHHKPAGKYGSVFVNEDGHTATENGRIRFWGVSLGFGACFPEHSEAEKIALHMAKYGINLVRFHHMDMYASPRGIWKSVNPDRDIDKDQLDKLDYFIYQLKENGIYTDVNLLVSRPFHPGKELHESIEGIFSEYSERKTFNARKTLLFFSDDINQLKYSFFEQLLTHYNPYTESVYRDEPAIAFIEPLNECGILHSYFSGYIRDLPDYYKEKLITRWNEWIFAKYSSIDEILDNWDIKSFRESKNFMKVSRFDEESLASWMQDIDTHLVAYNLEQRKGPNSNNALQITKKETQTPVIILQNKASELKPGIPYRLFFYIKAENMTKLEIEISRITTENKKVVFKKEINIGNFWVPYKSDVFIFDEPVDVQFSINDLNVTEHKIWFSQVEFEGALPLKSQKDEFFTESTIKLFDPARAEVISVNGNRDWFSFLMDLESTYWKKEIDYFKNTLNVTSLIVSTMASITTPSLLKEPDIICDIQYWTHPVFPGTREWDINDWFILNYPMVNSPEISAIGELAVKRVAGQPFIVAEYNHPYPNTFGAEAFLFLSAYASFQDWDGIIVYSYSQNEKDWGSEQIRNFFDIDQNPVKLASFIPAAMQFLRGDLQPARQTIQVPASMKKEHEIIGLKSRAWKVVDAEQAGLNPLVSILHKVEIVPSSLDEKPLFDNPVFENRNLFRSDTGEIIWDVSKKDRGVLTIQSNRSISLTGFLEGEYSISGIRIVPGKTLQQGFCVIALSVTEGGSFADAKTIIITALGTAENKNATWYEYPKKKIQFPPGMYKKITLRNKWGKFPGYTEGIDAVITFPFREKNITAWALDSKGQRKKQIPLQANADTITLHIHPRFKSLWYELERKE